MQPLPRALGHQGQVSGGKREFNCGGEAAFMSRLQHTRPFLLPFSSQSIHGPLVMTRNRSGQSDRGRVEVKLFEDAVDQVRWVVVVVDVIGSIACCIHR